MNIQTADLPKAACLEAGVSFLVVCLTSIAILTLPVLIYFFKKEKFHLFPYSPITFSFGVSIIALASILFLMACVSLLIQPGEWPSVNTCVNWLVAFTFVSYAILASLNIGFNKLKNSTSIIFKYKDAVIHYLFLITGTIRVILASLILISCYGILFLMLDIPKKLLIDPHSYHFALYLILSLLAFSRLYIRVKNYFISNNPTDTQNTDNLSDKNNNHNTLPKKSTPFAITFLFSISVILFYLLIYSYIFGPFLYIPVCKGGGYHTVKVNLILCGNADCIKNEHGDTNNLYLLAESQDSYYITQSIDTNSPRDQFQRIYKSDIYSINKNLVQSITYQKKELKKP
jgi:hypothetical protein